MSFLAAINRTWSSGRNEPPGSLPSLPASPVTEAPAAADTARDRLDACEMIEAELDSANASCRRQSVQTAARSATMVSQAKAVADESTQVAEMAMLASQDVAAVAVASNELTAAGREIAMQAARSSGIAQRAVSASDDAARSVAALGEAAAAINEVIRSIAAIASRTNLLALNATIEAARAGEAGRGFSVVAAEVKELSRQTAAATQDITARIRSMQSASSGSVVAVQGIGLAVREMDAANSAVAAAIEQQDATLREVAGRLQGASANTNAVAETIGQVAGRGTLLSALSVEAHAETLQSDHRSEELRDNLVLVLRRMAILGDRWNDQSPIQANARLQTPAWSGEVTVLEASAHGATLRVSPAGQAAIASLRVGSAVVFDIDGVGPCEGSIGATSSGRVFVVPQAGMGRPWTALEDRLSRMREADRHFTDAAQHAAAQVSKTLTQAVEAGSVSMDTIFDAVYVPIAGSSPPQFTTKFTEAAERLVQPLLDEVLELDTKVVGAFVADRSGYLPTHNRHASQPQKANDPGWNARHCRNRRIFDDRAGLAAARNTRPFLLQSYERDMGEGEHMMVKEADAPIIIAGRHWGAFRLMFVN